MGLLQKAVETYDAHANLVGKIREGHQPLAPIGHTVTSAAIEITLDGQGCLVNMVEVNKDDSKTIIPVTEFSASRTGKKACERLHPLCENLKYIDGQENKSLSLYLEQLQDWNASRFSHPMLQPIMRYVQSKTILDDLEKHSISKGKGDKLVRWRVDGIGEESGPCWTNQSLLKSYTDWYLDFRERSGKAKGFSMITGEISDLAKQHPKRIVSKHGNAKLISSNDTDNFTYLGRFVNAEQAATVDYVSSQKAHNALQWLIAEQGVWFGERTFVCWNPKGKEIPAVNMPFLTNTILCTNPTDYRQALLDKLNGWRSELPKTAGVIIAALDAATSGRLALTYYNELLSSDFLQRLYDWDNACCWLGWNAETCRYDAIRSPSLVQIINCAFGVLENKGNRYQIVADDKIIGQQIQRLISSRVDKAPFPVDIKQTLVNRASMPQAFEEKNKKDNSKNSIYQRLLSTACAVIRKYHHDYMKEDLAMVLEKERPDRSYQFGRLLAVLEKVERDTYDRDENREPYAIRLQSRYSQHPFSTFRNIEEQLERAYFPRLKPGQRAFYKRLIGEIIERINEFPDYEWNKPLGDTYLIGYYLQRNELYKPKTQATQEQFNDQKED